MPHKRLFALVMIVTLLVTACGGGNTGPTAAPSPTSTPEHAAGETLRIVAGSENEVLEPLIIHWAETQGYQVTIDYLGSVDISRQLQSGQIEYDAVWPANSLWLRYGDTHGLVQHEESIFRSPVVLGVYRSVAADLGWIDADVTMAQILEAAESGVLRFMMTSATQSNSGASFYFAALYAFAGQPQVLTAADLENPDVRDQITRVLGQVDRSSGSSGWLRTLFMDQVFSGRFNAMVNYETLIIETNQDLVAQGHEPLYVIYPVDGLAIADSPLGFIDQGVDGREDVFRALQTYLTSDPEAQAVLLEHGRRVGLIGLNPDQVDPAIFNPDWGIDISRVLQPITFPQSDVIQRALTLYQTAFRRPSCTVFVLDYSGSMGSNGGEQLVEQAMLTLLDQHVAEQYLLQGHPDDVTSVLVFSDSIMNDNELDAWTVRGNNQADLINLYNQIAAWSPAGGTNIFGAARAGLERARQIRTDECLPSVILMTDGADTNGQQDSFTSYLAANENEIPVFAILFANANSDQLNQITSATFARTFDGTADLVQAFRSAKGYN
ncbi:MAG: VWA domain-containing protein [Anaerolineae bacterium]|nr:VWA domain-containing protein [Anaerolineae bacterium]